MLYRIFFFLPFLFLAGCHTEILEPSDARLGTDFFPLAVGQYRIFEVEKITYNIINPPDTSKYQLKEVLAEVYPNQSDGETYRLERFSRLNQNESWKLDSVWTTSKNEQRAVVTENNVPFIKLAFPLSGEQPWDGNALNSRDEEMYQLKNIDAAIKSEINSPYNNLLDGDVVIAQHTSEDTVLTNINYLETYVKDIGLFYKKTIRLQYCNREECIGQGVIESGSYYKQTLIEYGQE